MNSLKPILDFYLERGGAAAWCQEGLRVDEDGELSVVTGKPAVRWCPQGVVYELLLGLGPSLAAFDQLNARVKAMPNGKFTHILPWNDKPERAWQDVEELLMMEDISAEPLRAAEAAAEDDYDH